MSEDFYPLTVARRVAEPGGGMAISFAVPEAHRDLFRFSPGQFLTFRAVIGGVEVRRSYSIAAGPGEALRIGVKKVTDGRFSTFVHDQLAVGDVIEAQPPRGRFVLAPSDGRERLVVAFAAGSGITPILGIARQALMTEPRTRMTLVYGNRSRDDVLFGEELEALKDQYLDRFEYHAVFSRSGEVEAPLFEGRISGDKVRDLGERLIDYRAAERIFLCGPGDMIKSTRTALMAGGIASEAITQEFFGSAGQVTRAPAAAPKTTADDGSGARVTVILDGSRHRLRLGEGETVLAAALRAGLKAPYSCAGGMCSTCRARVTEGSVRMQVNYALEPWEVAKGFVLACQAIPTSDELVVDWDAM